MESNWPTYGMKEKNFALPNDRLPNCINQAKPETVMMLAQALPPGQGSILLAFVMVPRLLDGSYLKSSYVTPRNLSLLLIILVQILEEARCQCKLGDGGWQQLHKRYLPRRC